jgi:DNA-binding transcriptional regulator YiaG
MSPSEFKEARQRLGLSGPQLARILNTDARTIRKWEADERASTARDPNPVACQVMRWMLDGFRPPEWPASSRRR